MKKITTLTIFLITMNVVAFACPVCERNQPKVLKGIVHGAGPASNWDYVGVAIITLAVIATLFYTIKWLVKPGEKNTDHIKFSILN